MPDVDLELPEPPRLSLLDRIIRQAGIDDDGRIRLPLWQLLALTALGDAAIDVLDDVNWRTVLKGLVVALLGMFAAAKGVEKAAQAYANRAAEWAGAVVKAESTSIVDEVLDGIVPVLRRPARTTPLRADLDVVEPPPST